ncbi:adenosine deaminase family protein [Paenibacillus odorifer]|uniref:Helicase ATP-binding domain-containing protein n=1 Tax=Paenibacillus odorifer TaxID=189426 RepID=A0AAD0KK18_9BACL|nr:hypothetical protein [Paenibacillus odorifer]AWV34614.1 hypothetical protein CD191_19435 [Paenibacillus odorifer]
MEDFIERAFGAQGHLSKLVNGYIPRAPQIMITKKVGESLENSQHLICEAGTGTGKSLGYLTPAARWAVVNKKTVIVCTHKIPLMNQIVNVELPRVVNEKEKIFGLKRNSILRIFANEFITVVLTAISSIQTENDFADMVFECAREMVEQNIIYREAMFDYTACYGRRGIPLKTVMNGFAKGLKLAKQKFNNIDIRFIANLDRTAQVKDNCKYIQELVEYRDMISLIAVGMDMQELGHSAHRQAEAFAVAKENGFFITGHVGEEVGPEGIWDAIQSIPFDRIDHGVRAVEDEKLLEWLAVKKILLTLCPASNISLEVYLLWDKYPIKKLIDNEVKVCINSDDPPCFHYDQQENCTHYRSG